MQKMNVDIFRYQVMAQTLLPCFPYSLIELLDHKSNQIIKKSPAVIIHESELIRNINPDYYAMIFLAAVEDHIKQEQFFKDNISDFLDDET
ncbi:MAG: hypothetical protein KIT27_05030 [Legionellales bacterium]|nr:hypothetical protein [Legionellales bacterium]